MVVAEKENRNQKYRDYLVDVIRAAGLDVIDRAEDIAGVGGEITDLTVTLYFSQGEVPTIHVSREHLVKHSIDIYSKKRSD